MFKTTTILATITAFILIPGVASSAEEIATSPEEITVFATIEK